MSDSVFLEYAETDLLRRGSLDLTDCREEEEMVEMGNSMGKEAVESLREAGSCAPCPGGREGVSEKPETWRAREREAEPAAGASESAVAAGGGGGGRVGGVGGRGRPSGGRLPPPGVDDFPSGDNGPSGRVAAGH